MRTSQAHLPSLLGAILFCFGALLLIATGLLMGMTALISLVAGKGVEPEQTILFIAFGFEAAVLLAAAFFSFQKFLQKPSADQETSFSLSGTQIVLFILLAGASILLGSQIASLKTINWLFLPIFTIIAIALPLWALWGVGARKLPLGTSWQTWSVLGLGMTLVPFILFTLEVVIAIIIFFVVIAYILTQPQLTLELQSLSQQIMLLGPESEAARDLLSPFLTRPGVMVIALV